MNNYANTKNSKGILKDVYKGKKPSDQFNETNAILEVIKKRKNKEC